MRSEPKKCPKCDIPMASMMTESQDIGGGAYGCFYLGEKCLKCGYTERCE